MICKILIYGSIIYIVRSILYIWYVDALNINIYLYIFNVYIYNISSGITFTAKTVLDVNIYTEDSPLSLDMLSPSVFDSQEEVKWYVSERYAFFVTNIYDTYAYIDTGWLS